MIKYTFMDRARGFVVERQRVLELLDEEDVRDIKVATISGTLPEYRDAIIIYLNALISGDAEAYERIRSACGEEIFQKLLDNDLKKIA